MLFSVLVAIAVLFMAYLLIKSFIPFKFCVLCAAVSSTWLVLLVLYKLGWFHDPVLLALLLGQSVTGIFYFVQRRVPSTLRVFTLPFFLSLTAIAYVAVSGTGGVLPVMVLLLLLWLAGYVAFSYRNDPGKKAAVNAVIDCCKEE